MYGIIISEVISEGQTDRDGGAESISGKFQKIAEENFFESA